MKVHFYYPGTWNPYCGQTSPIEGCSQGTDDAAKFMRIKTSTVEAGRTCGRCYRAARIRLEAAAARAPAKAGGA